jgi:hypothetical protein
MFGKFNSGIKKMIELIECYEKGIINFQALLSNLFGHYEFMDGCTNKELADGFHKYWDHLEEINALNEVEGCKSDINDKIIPEFKRFLIKYLESDRFS